MLGGRGEVILPTRNDHILAGNQRSGPFKVSVVGGSQSGSKIWRRERIEMTDPDLDQVAFLSGVCVCVCSLAYAGIRL